MPSLSLLCLHTNQQQQYAGGGVTPVIVLTAHGHNLDSINNGDLDDDLKRISGLAAKHGREIWFRCLHEANNDWYSWGVYSKNGNNAQKFREAFARMSNLLTNYRTLSNVKIQLGLNNKSPNDMNRNEARPFDKYMPDRSTYDNACCSAYNWADEKNGGDRKSMSFESVFAFGYDNLAKSTDASLGLCEGSTVDGTYPESKGDWYRAAINALKSDRFSRVTQAHFFLINVKVSCACTATRTLFWCCTATSSYTLSCCAVQCDSPNNCHRTHLAGSSCQDTCTNTLLTQLLPHLTCYYHRRTNTTALTATISAAP
jgi:Glycosyl hydrolase family 26